MTRRTDQDEIDDLQEENERLRDAIAANAEHHDCAVRGGVGPCDCWFGLALNGDGTGVDRLRAERAELSARMDRLGSFIQGEGWLLLGGEERADLLAQSNIMLQYRNVLDRRLARAGGES